MVRLIAGLSMVIGAVMWSAASGAPVPKAKAIPLYFPTTVGDKWTCRRGNDIWTDTVTSVERKGGVATVCVERVRHDPPNPDGTAKEKFVIPSKVVVSGDELTLVEFAGRPVKHPKRMLKPSLKPEASWKSGPSDVVTLLPPETIQVAAGRFEAVPTVLEQRGGDARCVITSWYVPEIGLVYELCRDEQGNVQVAYELLSYSAGKK